MKCEIKLPPKCAISKSAKTGPAIAIHFTCVDGVLLSSRLVLSDRFTYTGATPALSDWLLAYCQGENRPWPLLLGQTFSDRALQALQQVPFGQTISYGGLAALLGQPKAARAIGNACNKNPFPLLIPCHRVIQANGKLGGFAMDLEIKRRLLEFEASVRLPQSDLTEA